MPPKVVRTSESGGITYYDVLVDGEKIGRMWKVAGRSFSGAWRGARSDGSVIGPRMTRKEVAEEIMRSSGNSVDTLLRGE